MRVAGQMLFIHMWHYIAALLMRVVGASSGTAVNIYQGNEFSQNVRNGFSEQILKDCYIWISSKNIEWNLNIEYRFRETNKNHDIFVKVQVMDRCNNWD